MPTTAPSRAALAILSLAASLALVAPASAQSICATRKEPEACYKRFGMAEGERTDVVVVASVEKDRWRFGYRQPGPAEGNPPSCSQTGDLTLRLGSRVELWLIADRGIHAWKVPALGIEETAMAGSYAPVRVDTTKAGEFRSEPDAKGRKPPSIRILEPGAYGAWTRKTMGRHCTF